MINQHTYHFSLSLISSWRLSNSPPGSDVLLFLEFINIVSILFYNFIELSILLYTLLVSSFAQYKEYITWPVSLSNFSDVLLAFTCARAIGNLCSRCLGVNFLNPLPFCWLRKSRIFSATLIILLEFSISGISFFNDSVS